MESRSSKPDRKQCRDCLQIKPLEDFYKSKDGKCGRMARCKFCAYRKLLAWRAKNPERCKAIDKAYHAKNRVKRNSTCKKHYRKNRDKARLDAKIAYHKLKTMVYSHYGSVCRCCGETEVSFLSVDHMNNDGYLHRQILRQGNFYRWLVVNKFPQEYQILCMNCQFGKKHNGGVCPHQKRSC